MAGKHLTVTRRLPVEIEACIRRDDSARFNTDEHLYTSDERIAVATGADALIVTPRDVLDAAVIARLSAPYVSSPLFLSTTSTSI